MVFPHRSTPSKTIKAPRRVGEADDEEVGGVTNMVVIQNRMKQECEEPQEEEMMINDGQRAQSLNRRLRREGHVVIYIRNFLGRPLVHRKNQRYGARNATPASSWSSWLTD